VLKGQAQYDQPAYTFSGTFVKGVPSGVCSFTSSCAQRLVGTPKLAAPHVLADYGPSLRGFGEYTLPPGEYQYCSKALTRVDRHERWHPAIFFNSMQHRAQWHVPP
jgi:hypothetical protein